MKRRNFLKRLTALGMAPYLAEAASDTKSNNHIRLLRHATLIIQLGGKKILIDPMLSAKDEMDPVQNCGNDIRIPMVDLPIDSATLGEILTGVDAVFLTHTHRDHWDAAAQKRVDKNKLVFCQPVDLEKIKGQGFVNVRAIDQEISWEGIKITRTGGRHGTGEMGQKMGEVSGFVFEVAKHSIYVAGDTVWCSEVEEALKIHQPNVTILNTGGARFLTGDPITMTPDDVLHVHNQLLTKIIAVHMDAVNHCFVKREDLKKALVNKNLNTNVLIPIDGEIITW